MGINMSIDIEKPLSKPILDNMWKIMSPDEQFVILEFEDKSRIRALKSILEDKSDIFKTMISDLWIEGIENVFQIRDLPHEDDADKINHHFKIFISAIHSHPLAVLPSLCLLEAANLFKLYRKYKIKDEGKYDEVNLFKLFKKYGIEGGDKLDEFDNELMFQIAIHDLLIGPKLSTKDLEILIKLDPDDKTWIKLIDVKLDPDLDQENYLQYFDIARKYKMSNLEEIVVKFASMIGNQWPPELSESVIKFRKDGKKDKMESKDKKKGKKRYFDAKDKKYTLKISSILEDFLDSESDSESDSEPDCFSVLIDMLYVLIVMFLFVGIIFFLIFMIHQVASR